MKNLKYILLLLIIIPINTFAIEFYCDRNVKSDGTFSCIISNSSNSLYNFVANLDYPSEFIEKNAVYSKGYTNNGSIKNLNIIGPGYNAPTTIAIINFLAPTVSSNQSYSISLKNIKYKYLDSETNFRDNQNDLIANINVIAETTTTKTTTTNTKKVLTTTETTTKEVPTTTKLELKLNYMIADKSRILSCDAEDGKCEISLKNIEEPSKEGYTFSGWSINYSCDSSEKLETYILSKNDELYACYTKNTSDKVINYLEELTIENFKINFNKFTFKYIIDLKGETSKININAIPVNKDAKVEISDNAGNLVDGANYIDIKVIYNDIITNYTIVVNKNYKESAKLNDIKIDGYNFVFNQNIYEYNLIVKYGTSNLNLTVDADKQYNYTISGNSSVSNGSKILVVVGGENSAVTTYTINIVYDSFLNTYLYYIYGVIFSIFCIIVYFVVRSIRKNKKTKNISIENKGITKKKEKKKVKKEKKNKKSKDIEKENIEKL